MAERIFSIPLPTVYKGQAIRYRQPFTMAADLVVPASTAGQVFADSSFYNALDMPFEVTKLIPNVTTLDGSGIPQADPTGIASLNSYVRLMIQMITSNTPVTFVSSRLSVLIDKGALIWPFDAPVVLETRNGFKVSCDNQLTSAKAAGGIRMELTFVGSLLALAS